MSTAKKIGKLLLFYLIFYAVMSVVSAVCMWVFLQTLEDKTPKWILDQSLIGTNPAITYIPRSSSIHYKIGDNFSTHYLIRELDEFLAPYNKTNKPDTVKSCSFFEQISEDQVCDFSLSEHWLPCTKEYGYGYGQDSNGPCIFLKLNKIYGWIPEIYNSSNLHSEMSESLKSRIKTREFSRKHSLVWVECKEIDDKEGYTNIEAINYFPEHGFPSYYFPYRNIEGYLSPLVIVHFEKPRHGVEIEIECRAWAQNIYGSKNDWRNVVRFKLFIDEADG